MELWKKALLGMVLLVPGLIGYVFLTMRSLGFDRSLVLRSGAWAEATGNFTRQN